MIGIIVGPQGSGKGTQAEFIQKEFGLYHFSTGDLLRAERAKGTELGNKIKEIIDAGNLVPDEITNEMLFNELKDHKSALLDGYPRSLSQAEYIIKHYSMGFIVVLEISEDETIKRLSKRRICTATKKIFIADKINDADIEECKAAGGEIIQRDDDKPEAIKQRLSIYRQQTEPVINFYEQKGVPVLRIDGEQSIEDVWKEIKRKLEPVLRRN